MKLIQTITRVLPNGNRRILRLYVIKDGIGINCTIEYTNATSKSTFDGKVFRRTKMFDTFEKNKQRVYKHFNVGDEDTITLFKTIYVTYSKDNKRYAVEADSLGLAMKKAQELIEAGQNDVRINKCGRLPKNTIIVRKQ